MSHKIYLSLAMLMVSIACTAQIVTLRGKVINSQTGEPVPSASILSGLFGTSADGDGNFVFYVQQSVIEESGITVSSIGYQTIHITDITDNYKVSLTPDIKELNTVNISPGAEYIVEKAYRQIPNNYLNRNFNIIGIERMENSVRDSFGFQYYYWNNAEIKLYMSAYTDKPFVAQVGLIAKEDKEGRNPNALRINFTGGYTITTTHDFVHTQLEILKGNPDKYIYSLNRKEWINGLRVYVVNFFSGSKNPNAGILYIDTASYAFVRILFNRYNIKGKGVIDLDKVTEYVQYKKYGEKWALEVIKFNSVTDDKGYDVERSDEFQVATIDAKAAVPLPAQAIILSHSSDRLVLPYDGFANADKKIKKDVRSFIKRSFQKIQVPVIADHIH